MNKQQVGALIVALKKQAAAQREQAATVNHLAESDNALRGVIIQSLVIDEDVEVTTLRGGCPVYLSQKTRE